ncbi:spore coat protein [Alkalihalobacillus berkeleyi]|uniref:Spore coat protein n=2 Tax=Pseudalkalibacillus berkeleyi TaxID=1069813 RepID=A0ABS9GXC9_9BACL|nr:spore coat protein [Pseudalkalibacillus berkeleyi]MCF6136471.1 spore coat protein [Pseudalkalibacillus berkeleyi]
MQPNPAPTPPNMNHGGHEMFDSHEVLATFISVLDQYLIFDQYVKDQELRTILYRQHAFITDLYNICVEAFSTGEKPSHSTRVYKMQQNNNTVYGLTPGQPKKPFTSANEVNDQGVSGYMLGLIKSTGSLLGMTAFEMTNPVLRRVIADSVPNFIEMAYEIFLYQNKRHYYQVPQLTPQDMNQMLHSFAPAQQPNQFRQ